MSFIKTDNPNARFMFIHPDDPHKRQYLSQIVTEVPFIYLKVARDNDLLAEITHHAPDENTILILDAFDKLPQNTALIVLEDLLARDIQAVIISKRELSNFKLLPPNIQQHSNILNATMHIPDLSANKPILLAYAFGLGSARFNGSKLNLIPGETKHQIFFYVMENSLVTRDEIIEVFWPDIQPSRAVINFHLIRNSFDNALGLQFLQEQSGYYQVNPTIEVRYDATKYRNLFRDVAMTTQVIKHENYKFAYKLYKHDFLHGIQATWVTPIRDALRRQQSEVCSYLAQHQPGSSIGMLSQAFRYNPYREDVALQMMHIYMSQNLHCDALDVYDTIENNLSQAYSIKPSQQLQQAQAQAKVFCP